ncbi:MAG TPA: sulfatase-like hydrolase/transferase [Burkholderiaceae bacterium]
MRPSDPTIQMPPAALAPAWKGVAVGVLRVLWLALLVLPATRSVPATEAWAVDRQLLAGLACWLVLATRIILPARWFFPLTLPLALAASWWAGAALLRHVDLLDLASQWRTFRPEEVRAALAPYVVPAVLGGLVVASWCVACARAADAWRRRRALAVGAALLTLALAPLAPPVAWQRAWPTNALLLAITGTARATSLTGLRPPPQFTPRDPKATWHARATSKAARQTLVFIIGESIRADYLRECHGPERIRALGDGAIVACDVTAGADATHTSVPLLVSREMPGWAHLVSRDATFAHAFDEAGFETHWISVQAINLAWPDARFQDYPQVVGTDEAVLGPPLAAALARPAAHKAIVLHAVNAHEPYCKRYDPAQAPYPADCRGPAIMPSIASDPANVRATYANAVDATVRFIDGVIDQLRTQRGEVFLLFTPDHADNLYDDRRQLRGHALTNPTRWDIRVPAIFWANDAWRAAHPAQWANLQAQAAAPLMHADMVPTFLAAGGVAYDEPRKLAVDLLDATVPPRRRLVQRELGATTDWDTLVREAR